MQKMILVFLFFLSNSLVHAKKLDRKDYPHALLTQDYNILNAADLAINSCHGTPAPFSNRNLAYPYWKCFEVSKVKTKCDDSGHIPTSKDENALLTITVQDPESEHFYLPRRATDIENCHWFQERWKNATKGEKYVCLSGSFTDYNTENGHKISLWVFDKFKTKKSCISWFNGHCDLMSARKHGCKS